jgi:hypothetical protein
VENARVPRAWQWSGPAVSAPPVGRPALIAGFPHPSGEVPEWSIGTVSKTVVPVRVPWVRIPPSPPIMNLSAFADLRASPWRHCFQPRREQQSRQASDLFSSYPSPQARSRRNDLDTSFEAAEEVRPHIQELQVKAFEYARSCGRGGLTDVDLNAHFGTVSLSHTPLRIGGQGLRENCGERVALAVVAGHALWRARVKSLAE